MIHNKIHLISPDCSWPSVTLQVQNHGTKPLQRVVEYHIIAWDCTSIVIMTRDSCHPCKSCISSPLSVLQLIYKLCLQHRADIERFEKEMPLFEEHIKQYNGLLNDDPDARDPDAAPTSMVWIQCYHCITSPDIMMQSKVKLCSLYCHPPNRGQLVLSYETVWTSRILCVLFVKIPVAAPLLL